MRNFEILGIAIFATGLFVLACKFMVVAIEAGLLI
jgi:hypothetical protein